VTILKNDKVEFKAALGKYLNTHLFYSVNEFLCVGMIYNTYLLTPWCRVVLEKLAGLQLIKKFPAFYGT